MRILFLREDTLLRVNPILHPGMSFRACSALVTLSLLVVFTRVPARADRVLFSLILSRKKVQGERETSRGGGKSRIQIKPRNRIAVERANPLTVMFSRPRQKRGTSTFATSVQRNCNG